MSSGGRDRDARAARERTRIYQARQTFHDDQRRRRTRDNLIAGIGGGVLILGLVASQTVYFTMGPGGPAPSPSPTSSTTPAPSPESTTPAPTLTPTPDATPTPSSE